VVHGTAVGGAVVGGAVYFVAMYFEAVRFVAGCFARVFWASNNRIVDPSNYQTAVRRRVTSHMGHIRPANAPAGLASDGPVD
jgi:hypothetical protein